MFDRFQLALQWLDKAEGGFTVDNGGPTMRGVTQTTYNAYREHQGLPITDANGKPFPVSKITVGEWESIARTMYWNKAYCDALPVRTAIAVFDFAFNSNPPPAVKHLQHVLGVAEDGVVGPKTLARVQEFTDQALVTKYIDDHIRFYEKLVHDDPAEYAKYSVGWHNRMTWLRQFLATQIPDKVT